MVSVIIPTHNPRRDYLQAVLGALQAQTLPVDDWELVVVDNASDASPTHWVDLSWHRRGRVVGEPELGLTHARLRGFAETSGALVVMVDDDNVLAPDFLATASEIARARPGLGAFGGRCLADYEEPPPHWVRQAEAGLGVRDLGPEIQVFPLDGDGRSVSPRVSSYPACAPIGAGMVLRREAAEDYAGRVGRGAPVITDRRGDSLSSAGDNDLCLTVLESGWQVGYFPALSLRHLIPARRLTLPYHCRMSREAMRSFVLMLDGHGIRPWPAIPSWTVPLRVAVDWFRVQPWRSAESKLCWAMHRGRYEACGRLGVPSAMT